MKKITISLIVILLGLILMSLGEDNYTNKIIGAMQWFFGFGAVMIAVFNLIIKK